MTGLVKCQLRDRGENVIYMRKESTLTNESSSSFLLSVTDNIWYYNKAVP